MCTRDASAQCAVNSEESEGFGCDGTLWDIEVKSGRRKLRRISGSNLWPEQWKTVLRLLKFCHSPVDFYNGPEEDD